MLIQVDTFVFKCVIKMLLMIIGRAAITDLLNSLLDCKDYCVTVVKFLYRFFLSRLRFEVVNSDVSSL